MSDTTPETPKRKHLVETAGYWFNAGREAQLKGQMAAAVNGFENAYNHVENAYADLASQLAQAQAERDELGARACRAEELLERIKRDLHETGHELAALRAERDEEKELANHYHDLCEEQLAAIDRLRAENERLLAALRNIAFIHSAWQVDGQEDASEKAMERVAHHVSAAIDAAKQP